MSKQKTRKINIEIDEKTSEGIYSNLAIINHSASEFVMDFILIMPGSAKNKVKSRIIITPQHAKKLRKALNDNIERFEQNFGSIKDYENPKFQLNFGPAAQA
jgi:predicted transcriptional regulator|tara:strand:- start:1348 stop:1653 length:306 start_codon:yes stop_codon:yes gene_type:complete